NPHGRSAVRARTRQSACPCPKFFSVPGYFRCCSFRLGFGYHSLSDQCVGLLCFFTEVPSSRWPIRRTLMSRPSLLSWSAHRIRWSTTTISQGPLGLPGISTSSIPCLRSRSAREFSLFPEFSSSLCRMVRIREREVSTPGESFRLYGLGERSPGERWEPGIPLLMAFWHLSVM